MKFETLALFFVLVSSFLSLPFPSFADTSSSNNLSNRIRLSNPAQLELVKNFANRTLHMEVFVLTMDIVADLHKGFTVAEVVERLTDKILSMDTHVGIMMTAGMMTGIDHLLNKSKLYQASPAFLKQNANLASFMLVALALQFRSAYKGKIAQLKAESAQLWTDSQCKFVLDFWDYKSNYETKFIIDKTELTKRNIKLTDIVFKNMENTVNTTIRFSDDRFDHRFEADYTDNLGKVSKIPFKEVSVSKDAKEWAIIQAQYRQAKSQCDATKLRRKQIDDELAMDPYTYEGLKIFLQNEGVQKMMAKIGFGITGNMAVSSLLNFSGIPGFITMTVTRLGAAPWLVGGVGFGFTVVVGAATFYTVDLVVEHTYQIKPVKKLIADLEAVQTHIKDNLRLAIFPMEMSDSDIKKLYRKKNLFKQFPELEFYFQTDLLHDQISLALYMQKDLSRFNTFAIEKEVNKVKKENPKQNIDSIRKRIYEERFFERTKAPREDDEILWNPNGFLIDKMEVELAAIQPQVHQHLIDMAYSLYQKLGCPDPSNSDKFYKALEKIPLNFTFLGRMLNDPKSISRDKLQALHNEYSELSISQSESFYINVNKSFQESYLEISNLVAKIRDKLSFEILNASHHYFDPNNRDQHNGLYAEGVDRYAELVNKIVLNIHQIETSKINNIISQAASEYAKMNNDTSGETLFMFYNEVILKRGLLDKNSPELKVIMADHFGILEEHYDEWVKTYHLNQSGEKYKQGLEKLTQYLSEIYGPFDSSLEILREWKKLKYPVDKNILVTKYNIKDEMVLNNAPDLKSEWGEAKYARFQQLLYGFFDINTKSRIKGWLDPNHEFKLELKETRSKAPVLNPDGTPSDEWNEVISYQFKPSLEGSKHISDTIYRGTKGRILARLETNLEASMLYVQERLLNGRKNSSLFDKVKYLYDDTYLNMPGIGASIKSLFTETQTSSFDGKYALDAKSFIDNAFVFLEGEVKYIYKSVNQKLQSEKYRDTDGPQSLQISLEEYLVTNLTIGECSEAQFINRKEIRDERITKFYDSVTSDQEKQNLIVNGGSLMNDLVESQIAIYCMDQEFKQTQNVLESVQEKL